jgi:hypothetical protein
MHDRGERIDRFVLAEHPVAMQGQALAERVPAAGADPNDHALRIEGVVERGAELLDRVSRRDACARVPSARTGASAAASTETAIASPKAICLVTRLMRFFT